MTCCGGMVRVTVRRSTRPIRSMNGRRNTRPRPTEARRRPSRKSTPRWYSRSTRVLAAVNPRRTTNTSAATSIMRPPERGSQWVREGLMTRSPLGAEKLAGVSRKWALKRCPSSPASNRSRPSSTNAEALDVEHQRHAAVEPAGLRMRSGRDRAGDLAPVRRADAVGLRRAAAAHRRWPHRCDRHCRQRVAGSPRRCGEAAGRSSCAALPHPTRTSPNWPPTPSAPA